MTNEQIKDYLNKYSLTSKEKLAQHIIELKHNTKPNTALISELSYALIDEENLFFNFFARRFPIIHPQTSFIIPLLIKYLV